MIYDENLNPITDESTIDLSVGRIMKMSIVKPDVIPVDHITKFRYEPDDLEEVDVYIVDELKKFIKEHGEAPTDMDRLEARLAYVEMMTGLMEV